MVRFASLSLHPGARAGRPSSRPANRSLFANKHFANIGAGCPSFGGQRTARCARTALRSGSLRRSVVIEQSMNTNIQDLGFPSVMPLGCVSLALRGTAAPGCGRAARVGAFGHHRQARLAAVRSAVGVGAAPAHKASVVRAMSVRSTLWPNPSVERTHNGGARLFAPSPSAAPLRAAHVKR